MATLHDQGLEPVAKAIIEARATGTIQSFGGMHLAYAPKAVGEITCQRDLDAFTHRLALIQDNPCAEREVALLEEAIRRGTARLSSYGKCACK